MERILTGGASGATDADQGLVVPFYGSHQAGIATPVQEHLYFTAFDLHDCSLAELRGLLERWSQAAAMLTSGRPYRASHEPSSPAPIDPGEALGLTSARLTLTFGFGPGLFAAGRLSPSLGQLRPAPLRRLPPFPGDELDPSSSGGDLCVQACAEDPQVAFHAVHIVSMLGAPTATPRWSQAGFRRTPRRDGSPPVPRNLIGFQDGINNLRVDDPAALERFVWVQPQDGPPWMVGGTYLIARRIEIQFSSWDRLSLAAQEQTIGRHKASGTPLSAIPAHAHIRQASPATNAGQPILRRGFNYSPGTRRPGAGEAGQLNGGLFFIAFVRSPDRQFIPLQRRLAAQDALSAFAVHTSSAIFAIPPGASRGGFVGEGLFG